MNFFSLFGKKEVREAPQPTLQQTYEQSLEHQSYCDVVKKQSDFLRILFEKYKYDPLSISTVFDCMNIISNNLAKIPWELKKDKEIIDPIYLDTLLEDSNLTSFIFIKQMILDVLKEGDGYAYIYRDGSGKPISLRYFNYHQVIPFYDEQKDRLLYQIPLLGKRKYIEPVNVIHFIMNSKDGITGRGVLQFAHNTLDICSYTDKATQDYFKNGMSVSGILKSAGNLNDKQRDQIRKGWRNTDGSIRILEGSLDYQQVQSTSKEAELTSNRMQNAIEICRFFGISPVLVGDLSHTVYNQIEQAQLDLVQNTLSPYITMIEKELNRKLLTINERKIYYIDLDEDTLIKQDKKSFIDSIGSLTDKGIITRNEAREQLGYPKIDDEFADSLSLTYKNNEEITQEKNTNKENEEE